MAATARDALHLIAENGGPIVGTCRVIVAGRTATLSRMRSSGTARPGHRRDLLSAAEGSRAEQKTRRIVPPTHR